MNNDVNERIRAVIDYIGKSVYSVAKEISVSQPTLKACVDGSNKPSFDTIGKLLSVYPEINPTWLITGKGEMILSEDIVELTKKLNPANRLEKGSDERYGENWKYPEYIINSKLKGANEARGMFLRLEKTNNSGTVTKNYNDIFGMIEVLFIGLLKYGIGNNMNRIINSYLKNEIEWEAVATKYKEQLKKAVELFEILEPYKNVIEEIFEKFADFNDKHDRLFRFDDIVPNTKQ